MDGLKRLEKSKKLIKIPIWIKQHRQINTLENKLER